MNPSLTLPTSEKDIILRELTPDDSQAYFDAYDSSRSEIGAFDAEANTRYLTPDSVLNSIIHPSNPAKLRFGIWNRGNFVGSANITPDGDTAEIGYWIKSKEAGKGYATLAAKTITKYATEKFTHVIAVVDTIDSGGHEKTDDASIRVLEKSGYRQIAQGLGKITLEYDDKTQENITTYALHRLISALDVFVNAKELIPAIKFAKDNPEKARDIFEQYAKIVGKLFSLNEDEIDQIHSSNVRLKASRPESSSASKQTASDLLGQIGKYARRSLSTEPTRSIEPSSPFFVPAIEDFVRMTDGGSKLKGLGKEPVDGDPESDNTIWGHTQITDPETLLNFTFVHYLERYFRHALAGLGINEQFTKKDSFINAMTDVISLDHVGERNFDYVYNEWIKPRSEGGLGWIKPDRIKAFSKK